jgi:hypothetical protein
MYCYFDGQQRKMTQGQDIYQDQEAIPLNDVCISSRRVTGVDDGRPVPCAVTGCEFEKVMSYRLMLAHSEND